MLQAARLPLQRYNIRVIRGSNQQRLTQTPYNIRVIRVIRGLSTKKRKRREDFHLSAPTHYLTIQEKTDRFLPVGKCVLGVKGGNCAPCRSYEEVCKGIRHRGNSLIF